MLQFILRFLALSRFGNLSQLSSNSVKSFNNTIFNLLFLFNLNIVLKPLEKITIKSQSYHQSIIGGLLSWMTIITCQNKHSIGKMLSLEVKDKNSLQTSQTQLIYWEARLL